MPEENERRSTEDILKTITHLEYRNQKAVEELSDQLSETNARLAQISRRLWAQSVVAWIQLIWFLLVAALLVLLLAGVFTTPSPLDLLRFLS